MESFWLSSLDIGDTTIGIYNSKEYTTIAPDN